MELRTFSADDLIQTLTVIANDADEVLTRCTEPSDQRHALFQIKWQALEAIERAEKGAH